MQDPGRLKQARDGVARKLHAEEIYGEREELPESEFLLFISMRTLEANECNGMDITFAREC